MEWIFLNPSISISVLFLLLIGLIVLIRISLSVHAKKCRQEKGFANTLVQTHNCDRNKYPQLRVLNRFSTHLAFGFIFSLSFVVVLINWTTEEISIIPVIELMEELESAEIVQLQTPPPPPPPPPLKTLLVEPDIDGEEVEVTEIEEDEIAESDSKKIEDEISDVKIFQPPLPTLGIEDDLDIEEIFEVVEQMPRFSGCEELGLNKDELKLCSDRRMLEFISRHLRFSALARENRIEGVVLISFVVNREGRIEDPIILRDPGGGLGEQALKVVQMMNDLDEPWIPGIQAGRKVNVRFNLPVRFSLN